VSNLAEAEAVGKRGVDVHGLAGDPLLPERVESVQSPHVVQAVGQLYHHDADVFGHGEEHLAEVVGLNAFVPGRVLRAQEVEAAELGNAFNEAGDVGAESLREVIIADSAVFDDVVKQGSGDGGAVQLEFGDGHGRVYRVDHVGVPSLASLAVVGVSREVVRFFDEACSFR
jgi:hypothetical protein